MRESKFFTQGSLSDYLDDSLGRVTSIIHAESDQYLLNVDEDQYIAHLVSDLTLLPPELDFNNLTISHSEKMILASRHPSAGFFMDSEDMDKSYLRQVITYHIPFTGNIHLLDYYPNPRIEWTHSFVYNQAHDGTQELTFDVVNFSNDPSTVKRESDYITNNLATQVRYLANQVNGYNDSLKSEVSQRVKQRKQDIMKKSDFLTQLGVPVRKRDDLPETFSVPSPNLPKKIIPKPVATSPNPVPDPTLNMDVYEDILRVFYDLGKAIERMPSTYSGKSEEDLRDHFLMYLEPRFEGSATGETFNKSGKTDILLRYENTNIFVAECKFWSGESNYLKTIDQLLSYLTWRDSKVALVLFVKNKDFSPIIQKVQDTTPQHPNYLVPAGVTDESWLRYKFHLNGDKNRTIHLSVLLFHFPEI